MSKNQSSFYMGNEFNGYGQIKYLKGKQYQSYPPVSQDKVKLTPNFQNYMLSMLGSVPIVINPKNANPMVLILLGSMANINKANVIREPETGNYLIKFNVTSKQELTDGAYPNMVEIADNKVPLFNGIPNQWVPYGEPEGARWKYYKDSHYVKADWVYIEKNRAWYYLGNDEFMVTDWKEIKGRWYYFISNIVSDVETDGHMALGWMKIKGLWYYFKEEESAGYMVTGWREIKGKWYYFKTKAEARSGNDFGYMYSQKWLEYGGKWYYFNKDGEMVTSELINWKGSKYFLKSDGTMAVDETIVDPKTKITYKADENGVCREIKNGIITISLKDSKNFVKIVDGSDIYYGGDQEWFDYTDSDKKKVAREGGCGTVASANIVAYMACHNTKYKKLYSYSDYSKANYLLHMKDMYEYVTPRHIANVPFGVWPIGMIEDGVEEFASDRHIELKAVRKHDAFTRDNITKYIKEGLEKDSPVAMLIGTNALDGITITMPNGTSWIQDISLHWVTITELKIDEVNDTVKVKVSTWGGWCELDLDEYLEEWIYTGILYFE